MSSNKRAAIAIRIERPRKTLEGPRKTRKKRAVTDGLVFNFTADYSVWNIRISDLRFISDFEIRISNLILFVSFVVP